MTETVERVLLTSQRNDLNNVGIIALAGVAAET